MKLTEFVDKMDRTKAMELLEYLEETDDELRLKVAELLMDGHLCELTATRRIESMKAPVLMSAPDTRWATEEEYPMLDYMKAMNLSATDCYQKVENAYAKAREKANTLSFEAPAIPQDTTIWDAYYAMAMVISDYWFSINGDMDKAAMMAYEVVSDIDRK